MEMALTTICRALNIDPVPGAEQIHVTSVVSDSREVRPGALFVCVPGERVDGHDFAVSACSAGAAAVLASHEPAGLGAAFPSVPVLMVSDTVKALGRVARAARDAFKGVVTGLTGTAGKTTTREWLMASLAAAGTVAGTKGNYNNQLGLPLCLLAAGGQENFWVFECGISRAGDMEELGAILAPDIAVVLNAGEGHTEGLGHRSTAFHKTRLFGSVKPGGICVASADYPDLVRLALDSRPDTLFFSAGGATAALPAGQPCCCVREEGDGTFAVTVTLDGRRHEEHMSCPLGGRAGAENLACVCLVCALLGVDFSHVRAGLAAAGVPGSRYRRLFAGRALVIDDSYNANPLSMSRMLALARAEAGARESAFAVVLGEMGELGEASEPAHRRLGAEVSGLKPLFVLWKGGHADSVRAGLSPGIPFCTFSSDAEFEKVLRGLNPPPDITVLCKGSRANHLESVVSILEKTFAREGR